jgi:hypothetical protein
MTPYIAMTPYMMESLVLWGLVATTAMAAILQLSQGLGLSRMSLTFLMGSAFSGDRSVATILGFVLYIIGGWLFAFLYFLVLYQYRNLYVVGGIHSRAHPRRVFARLRHPVTPVHPSPNGVGTPWRHKSPPT